MNARQKRTDQRAQDRDTDSRHNAARVARIKAQAIGKPCPYQEQRDKLAARPAVWIGLDDARAQPITAAAPINTEWTPPWGFRWLLRGVTVDNFDGTMALILVLVGLWVIAVGLCLIGLAGYLYQTFWVLA